ncbi:MAG: hypothetical protein RRX88_03235, partial [Raoultibacter sp.]
GAIRLATTRLTLPCLIQPAAARDEASPVTTRWGSLNRGQRVTGAALGHDAVGSLNLGERVTRLRPSRRGGGQPQVAGNST